MGERDARDAEVSVTLGAFAVGVLLALMVADALRWERNK
jgi:hypothetical protein